MKLTTVKEIYKEREKYLDKEVTVGGWVRSVRDSKTFGFIVLHDGSFFETLQVVYHDTMENFAEISKLNVGAAIIVKGTLVATPQAKQPFEIQAAEVTVEGNSAPDYPLQKKRHSLEYLRTITHLRPRTNTFQAVFRVRSLCAYAIHRFFQEQGFVYVHTPLITGSDCEGAGEMFQVTTLDMNNVPTDDKGAVDYSQDFFGKETNLTVSGQLNCETFAQAFRNVYTFGPTFRAENSNTTRHAAEFWMIEPECAFADLNDNMDLAEAMLKYVIRYVLENAPEEMNFFNSFVDKGLLDRLNHVINSEFGHVTYTEAVELLEKNNDKFDYKVFWGCDLQTEHERYLTEEIFKKPVFVTDYPKEIKAFYMKMNEDNKTVAAMDCLVPGIGEIIGYVEYTYLMQLSDEERKFKYERFISSKIPCVIFSTMTRPSQDMIDLAVKYNVPTFVTERTTSSFMAEIIRWLGVQLAPCISIHGVLVDVYGEGVLITGESGIGKSEAALELIKRGHRLVSDDVVELRKVSDVTLVGSAPDITRHFIELRGIGIIDVKTLFGVESVKDTQSVDLVIKLEEWDRDKEYDRLGLHEEYTEYLGNKIVCHSLPIRPGRNLAIIVESAAVNHRQKKMGYNAAEELYKRVQANLAKKREEK